jgi:hypothetical protein
MGGLGQTSASLSPDLDGASPLQSTCVGYCGLGGTGVSCQIGTGVASERRAR